MYIKDLSLLNFRNIQDTTISFGKKINILYGDNAQGKTNLLEAVYICSTGRSHKTHIEGQLVKFGYDEAHIRTFICGECSNDRIDVHVKKDNRKGMAINGLAVKKMSDFFGTLHVVMFSPEDLRLVKGGPSERRRFMDMELCQLSNIYCRDLQNYHKVLKQRNNLLKNVQKNKELADTISVWDEQLIAYAEKIIDKRAGFVEKLNDISSEIHNSITSGKEKLSVSYKPNVEKNAFANVFNNLMVNCKFRAMTPSYDLPNNPDEGYCSESVIDYNYYASGTQKSNVVFEDESGVAYSWEGYAYAHKNYYEGVVDANSIITKTASDCAANDPKFVNFPINDVALTDYIYQDAWDFHVQAGSPVLAGAYDGTDTKMAPYFGTEGLQVNGQTYTSPKVEARFGAYGTK